MRITDIALAVAALGAFVSVEAGNRINIASAKAPQVEKAQLITCPLRKPDFTTIMHAAILGDGTVLLEQQTNTRVHHIKDC